MRVYSVCARRLGSVRVAHVAGRAVRPQAHQRGAHRTPAAEVSLIRTIAAMTHNNTPMALDNQNYGTHLTPQQTMVQNYTSMAHNNTTMSHNNITMAYNSTTLSHNNNYGSRSYAKPNKQQLLKQKVAGTTKPT